MQRLYEKAIKHMNIELDLVDYCNMACNNCVRGCNLRGNIKRSSLSLKDIEDFIVQSIDLSIEWSTIRLVGGEPTLHPQLVCIAKMIKEEYIIKHSPKTTLNLYSNGIVEYADLKKELKKYVNMIVDWYVDDTGSHKKSKDNLTYKHHYCVYIKPADIGVNYIKSTSKCTIPWNCGMGFTSRGYGICCNVSNFIRIFDEFSDLKTLTDLFNEEKWIAQAHKYCINCGIPLVIYGNFVSRFWMDTFLERGIDTTSFTLLRVQNGK